MATELAEHLTSVDEDDEQLVERTDLVKKAGTQMVTKDEPESKSDILVLKTLKPKFDPLDGLLQHVFQQRKDSDDESDSEEAFCSTCGDRIHDLEKFKENKQNCQECTALKELGIIKMITLKFTIDFFDNLIFGVCYSPMVWIWIPLIDDSATLFIVIISIYLVIAGILLFFFVCYLYKYKVVVLHKIPLGLTPIKNYTYIMMICVLLSNILICIETLRIYQSKTINIVFQCNNLYAYGLNNIPSYCFVYSHLITNAMIIFICAFLINLILMRGLKYDAKKSWSKVKHEVIPEHHQQYQYYDNLEKRYYSIHKFMRSPVPTIRMFIKRHEPNSIAWYKSWIVLIAASCFCLIISCSSFYILGNDFIDKLSKQPAQYIPVILSIASANIMFNLLFVALYELSWVFMKAYAVMSVAIKPFKDAASIHESMSVKFHNNANANEAIDNLQAIHSSGSIYGEMDINVNDIKIWWDLRSYAFQTLPLFYEISAPIVTVLVLSVMGLTFYFLYQLFITYENDVEELKSAIRHENVQFVLLVFTAVLIVETMYTLKFFLRPYAVLYAQIKMAEKQVIALRFEMVNEQKYAKRKKYLSECISLYEKLIAFMKVEVATQAPRILGLKVTYTKLQALQSYIISFVVVFAGSVWESWFGAVHSLGTN